jgi:hypothetical protein
MCQKQINDIANTAQLESFRKKHEEWRLCLNGDDVHSIWRQQSSLLWDYALFQTINELRKESDRNLTKETGFNASVLRLFDAGFVVTQATGIRRLMDKQWPDPLKRVISLKALVDDITENRELLTREIYLACHAWPYDPSPAKQRFFDSITSSGQKFSYVGMDTRGSEAWAASEEAHKRFDKLSETLPTARAREDVVSPKWFDVLKDKIKICEDICTFTDKFIAHAADPTSRTEKDADQVKLTLDRLGECHQAMIQVANFIGGPLLQDTACVGLPTPQFNHLENLDKAWLGKGELSKAQDYWKKQADQIEKWTMASLL